MNSPNTSVQPEMETSIRRLALVVDALVTGLYPHEHDLGYHGT